MKVRQLCTLIIGLVGAYLVLSFILVSGASLIKLITLPMAHTDAGWVSPLVLLATAVFPFVCGCILFAKARVLAGWMCHKLGLDEEAEISAKITNDVAALAFALLGLYMFSITLPAAVSYLALSFASAARATDIMGQQAEIDWSTQMPSVVYHIVAVGFSLFVFLRGKSISRFVASLRR